MRCCYNALNFVVGAGASRRMMRMETNWLHSQCELCETESYASCVLCHKLLTCANWLDVLNSSERRQGTNVEAAQQYKKLRISCYLEENENKTSVNTL